MKKIFKIIGIIFIAFYCLMTIGLTICLLNYNDYNITEINDKTLIIITDSELESNNYKKGDLVVVTKNDNSDIAIGDKIFFYDIDHNKEEVIINIGSVVNKEKITDTESTFTMNGEYLLSSEYVIGKTDTSKIYHGFGSVLAILESRLGFLFLIIFPILVLFIYEIYAVIREIKNPDEK